MTAALQARLRATDPVLRTGRVRGVFSTHVEADGPNVPLGTLCTVEARSAGKTGSFRAEVVRISRDGIVLSPFEDGVPTFAGAQVRACATANLVPVGDAFLGRVVDALGQPADGGLPISADAYRPLHAAPPGPLERVSPTGMLATGIRAIDGLLTLGVGQRVGIFAASGVGKTSLMTQIVQQTVADVAVVCLVGERGREVEALWSEELSEVARRRTTLVAATSDQSAVMRVRAGYYALALADFWRNKGAHVLLVLDSVTRLAMALREIGLAAGEPPTIRAYTPSVFSAIPKIVERCGALRAGGAITAIMTVLSETDDIDDPVSEMMKSLLDGHILLSRQLAEHGHFPAIDVPRSVSRQADGLATPRQRMLARQIVEWLSLHGDARALIDAGLHAKGANPVLDRAVERYPAIVGFLRQGRDRQVPAAEIESAIERLCEGEAP
jgi:flagellum-specific ATP synthase